MKQMSAAFLLMDKSWLRHFVEVVADKVLCVENFEVLPLSLQILNVKSSCLDRFVVAVKTCRL